MDEHTTFKHVALTYADKDKAKIFFTNILGIPLRKTFTVSAKLSDAFFGIKEEVDVDVYDNGEVMFEHTCIEINNQQTFIERCRKYGIEPILADRNGKIYVFVRDFSDNLFEIKERQ